MPTIGTVIGGASHLADYGALEYAQAYNPVTAGYNPGEHRLLVSVCFVLL